PDPVTGQNSNQWQFMLPTSSSPALPPLCPSRNSALQPIDQPPPRREQFRALSDQQVALEEMAGEPEPVEDIVPPGLPALDQEARQAEQPGLIALRPDPAHRDAAAGAD